MSRRPQRRRAGATRRAPNRARRSNRPAGRRRARATRRGRPRRPARRLRRLTRGDRPYFAALLMLLVLLALMAVGPLQNLIAATDRVAALEHGRDELAGAVTELEQRRDRLQDLEEIELLAREELGLVRPGEIPFVVVTPGGEDEPLAFEQRPALPSKPWYRRLLDALLDRL